MDTVVPSGPVSCASWAAEMLHRLSPGMTRCIDDARGAAAGAWTEGPRGGGAGTDGESGLAPAGTSTPVFLDDLPPVEEMAMIALSDVWVPVLAALRDLDGKDDVEIVTGHDGD